MSIITTSLYDCYAYVIGLYKGTCECFDPKIGHTLDYNTSYSGLYLNKLTPLSNLQGLENCENSDLWDMMAESRDQAIINFVTDLNRLISAKYKILYHPFSGIIGRTLNKKDRAITKNYSGVILRCNPLKSGKMTFEGIGTLFNYTGTITVTVYDNLNNNHGSFVLNTTEDVHTANAISELELPLYNDYVDFLEYYLTYPLGTHQPRDNDLSCNCGSFRPYYSLEHPYYTKKKDPIYGWANYVMAGGIEVDDVSNFLEDCDGLQVSKYMNGLTLRASFNCNFGETYCKDELDFTGDPIAGAIAHAIWYRAGFLLVDMIVMSGEINRQTMMNHEQLIEYQKEWVLKYNEMLQYIADNIDVSKSGCFGCRDKVQIHRHGILI